jgi:hypothetical protein
MLATTPVIRSSVSRVNAARLSARHKVDSKRDTGVALEQAVIVHLKLYDSAFGSPEEREPIYTLEEQLDRAIQANAAGEFDGDEFGEGECVLFMYGEDANRIFRIIEPILKACPAAKDGYAIIQFGEARDPSTTETRVRW